MAKSKKIDDQKVRVKLWESADFVIYSRDITHQDWKKVMNFLKHVDRIYGQFIKINK